MPLIPIQPTNPDLQTLLCETDEQEETCRQIRIEVFCDEQGYLLHQEIDEKDPSSDHILLYLKGAPVGTIRWWPFPSEPNSPPSGKLGRLAVLKRARVSSPLQS
ncbi:hypothetical protein MNV49_002057 [Pseudohyphozyma bogoriensis]|nr:hypothetical protein MNV49_002057 [Pseudohyphozyma bogoriensis]